MRKTGSTAAALVAATLVAGTAVTAVGASTASNAAPGRDAFTRQVSDDADVARAALKAVAAHPQAVHSGDRQAFTVTGALVDRDGTSHVRMARTYAGLPVVGVTDRVRSFARVWLRPSHAPCGDWWTTRSPPITGSPA